MVTKSLKNEVLNLELNLNKVYDAGVKNGTDAGAKNEYDRFWKRYQNYGDLYNCAYMYAFAGWNDNTFKPKYSQTDMTGCGNMFNTCGVTDLKAALERQGVTFDFSKCTNFGGTFAYSKITVIPTINTRSASTLSSTFAYASALHTIEKLILKTDGSQTFSSTFSNCSKLANIVIEGVIGRSIDFSHCPLTPESAISVISALKNYSGTSSSFAYTIKFSDKTWSDLNAYVTAPEAYPTWQSYVFDMLAWNV